MGQARFRTRRAVRLASRKWSGRAKERRGGERKEMSGQPMPTCGREDEISRPAAGLELHRIPSSASSASPPQLFARRNQDELIAQLGLTHPSPILGEVRVSEEEKDEPFRYRRAACPPPLPARDTLELGRPSCQPCFRVPEAMISPPLSKLRDYHEAARPNVTGGGG